MLSTDGFENISHERVLELVSEYIRYLPAGLEELDRQRYETIPKALAVRRDEPKLTSAELTKLMEWKLKHGKFRPTLMGLVRQNSEGFVGETTKNAFSTYDSEERAHDMAGLRPVVKELTALKGVGPATASLLLSVHDPQEAPFFSDELFRYVNIGGVGVGEKMSGWDRKIAYSEKEYLDLYQKVLKMLSRLNVGKQGEKKVTAVDVEKAAYVLGRQAALGEDSVSKVQKPKSIAGTKRASPSDGASGEGRTPSPAKQEHAEKKRKQTAKPSVTRQALGGEGLASSVRATRSRKES